MLGARRHPRRGAARRRVRVGAARRGRRARAARPPRHARAARTRSAASPRSTATRSRACCSASSRLAQERPDVASVDLNPLIVRGGVPIAVDALVELDREPAPRARRARTRLRRRGARALPPALPPARDHRGRRVDASRASSASSRSTTCCASATRGELFAVNRDGAEVLGTPTLPRRRRDARTARPTSCSCARRTRPTWSSCARARRRACARRSSRAAATARRARTGRALERELVAVANALGIVLAGPNGQGVISTPVSMCAQIVAPYPPPGPDLGGEPERQPRLVVPELRGRVGRRDQQGDLVRQLRADHARRLPRLLRRRSRRPRSRSPTSRACADGARFVDALRAFTRAQAARAA